MDIAIKGKKATHSLALKVKGLLEEKTEIPFLFDIIAYSKNPISRTEKAYQNKREDDLSEGVEGGNTGRLY